MKKISKRILLCLGAFAALGTFAQDRIVNDYPDSVKMKVDENVEIIFSFYRISKKSNYYTDELWRSALNVMETAIQNSEIIGGKEIFYTKTLEGGEEVVRVEVKPLERKESYIIGSVGTEEFQLNRNEFHLIQEGIYVTFSLNNLNELQAVKEVKIESLWQQIDQKYTDEGSNNVYYGTGAFNYGNANVNSIEAKSSGKDNIALTLFGVGLGYYRDRFVTDLGSKISFKLQDRLGNDWIEIGALFTQQWFFTRDESNDYKANLNGWVTGFFKYQNKHSNEFGVGIGGLVHRSGDFYDGATFKLVAYGQKRGSNFSFSPELIFTNDFKEAFPALRIGLSF